MNASFSLFGRRGVVVFGSFIACLGLLSGAVELPVLVMPDAVKLSSSGWRQLPSYPREKGVAGVLAGHHDGVLIAAGGANFPDQPPWEGGKKKTYADIQVWRPGEQTWRSAGELPEPRGYAAVISAPAGVLAIGGENAERVFTDSLWLRWDGHQAHTSVGPALPFATTSPAAVQMDGYVYVAAGFTADIPRLTRAAFWRLDLRDPSAGWSELPVWPGPSRAQAVMAALEGAVYLFSGIEVAAGSDGKPHVNYLTDAYRFRPGHGWEKLPDLPHSVVAAPSPAPVSDITRRIFVLGGVDGRLAGKQPRETRVPSAIEYLDVAAESWKRLPDPWPDPVVTAPAVHWGDEWIIVSGEIMSGVRTPHVWSWKTDSRPVASTQLGTDAAVCELRWP